MERKKYVDESWKESAEEAKQKFKKEPVLDDKQVENSNPEASKESPLSVHQDINPEQAEQTQSEAQEYKAPADEAAQYSDIQINFMNYVTSLGYQAMIFLGEIPHPVSNKTEKNIDQAKFLIDTLIMMREKTKGNLNKQEENLLNATTYELELKFVELKKKEESHA